jgi:hypothetical protein
MTFPAMSSCPASRCTCFSKALSAFATLASSLTGDEPLSCPSAFNYSAPYHNRRQNQQHSPPGNPTLLAAVPNAAGQWSSSRPSPPLRSCSVLRLRSSVPYENNFQNPQISIHLSARSALVCLAAKKSSCPWPQNLFQPQSSSTSITVSEPYCSSPIKYTPPSPTACHLSTLSKTHSHRLPPLAPGTRKRLPRSGFLQAVVSKATATDSNEAIFFSAVASDTTLA